MKYVFLLWFVSKDVMVQSPLATLPTLVDCMSVRESVIKQSDYTSGYFVCARTLKPQE